MNQSKAESFPFNVTASKYSSVHAEDSEIAGDNIFFRQLRRNETKPGYLWIFWVSSSALLLFYSVFLFNQLSLIPQERSSQLQTDFPPFSTENPINLGVHAVDREEGSKPGNVFGTLLSTKHTPIPTSLWCENLFLGVSKNDELTNRVYTIPYVVDTAGPITGLRTHSVVIKASDFSVITELEFNSGVTLGCLEKLSTEHVVVVDDEYPYITHQAVQLQWSKESNIPLFPNNIESSMKTAIVRGSPYSSMEYFHATPRIITQQTLHLMTIDQKLQTTCLKTLGASFLVEQEIMVHFEETDHTWMIFVSEPTRFNCKIINEAMHASAGAYFELQATAPMEHGMVRLAMANNCTSGRNRVNCHLGLGTDSSSFEHLLRTHADVYPTAKAHVSVAVSSGLLEFNFVPSHMSRLRSRRSGPVSTSWSEAGYASFTTLLPSLFSVQSDTQLLMFALPHHQDKIIPQPGSLNKVLNIGCVPTLQGRVCPVIGDSWLLREELFDVTFTGTRAIREELVDEVASAVDEDLKYEIPINYRRGAGDTYFSGKMLAKLARILLVAEEVGVSRESQTFITALDRLREGTEIWLNGSARSPFLYDSSWGGLISCGCNFNGDEMTCYNSFPDCPSLGDPGQNFGNAFYNDHHFHYGYHIYAAAVIVKFDHEWGRRFHERVLLLVRDIANPSHQDPFFPTWRHKDWFLGSSWANGIIGVVGRPNPNGRNEESSAEAIAAYEAVALYGQSTAAMYASNSLPGDSNRYETSLQIQQMGQLLMSTEITSAQRYWHVRSPALGVKRIYPDIYTAKVVGMIWSMLVQEQTWFGGQAWKSFGIQVITITPASEQRDDIEWVREMLPEFELSCSSDPVCRSEGWSILVSAAAAELCEWESAASSITSLPDSVYQTAGGNGQSKSNSLWWVATRDCE